MIALLLALSCTALAVLSVTLWTYCKDLDTRTALLVTEVLLVKDDLRAMERRFRDLSGAVVSHWEDAP